MHRYLLPLALLMPALAAAQPAPLADTGQTLCYAGNVAAVSCTEATAGNTGTHPGQDARYGADAAMATGRHPGKTGGGAAGFDFTRICQNGQDEGTGTCPANPPAHYGGSPAATDWACTRDNTTGVVWALQSGFTNPWSVASAPGHGNGLNGRCGLAGWRLPTLRELQSAMHYGSEAPGFDVDYLATFVNAVLLASEEYGPDTTQAWAVHTFNGSTVTVAKSAPSLYRFVHTASAPATSAFTPTASETVQDGTTGLLWDACAIGQSGAGCAQGSAQMMDWAGALKAAASANASAYKGHTDWRVPNVKELASLLRPSAPGQPMAIDPAFLHMPGNAAVGAWFHTSTTNHSAPGRAWLVNFRSPAAAGDPAIGFATQFKSDAHYFLRLVRGGSAPNAFDALAGPAATLNVDAGGGAFRTVVGSNTGYWQVLPAGQPAPTAADLRANGTAIAPQPGVTVTVPLPGNLAPGASYVLYFVLYDGTNTPSGITVRAFSAAAPASMQAVPTLSQWGVLLLSGLLFMLGIRRQQRA